MICPTHWLHNTLVDGSLWYYSRGNGPEQGKGCSAAFRLMLLLLSFCHYNVCSSDANMSTWPGTSTHSTFYTDKTYQLKKISKIMIMHETSVVLRVLRWHDGKFGKSITAEIQSVLSAGQNYCTYCTCCGPCVPE